jgi:hypothetical protein
LRLVEVSKSPHLDDFDRAALEMAAATMANHVADWHFGHLPSDIERQEFAKQYPDWDTLRKISNGAKHTFKRVGEPRYREIEWEDIDFWDAFRGPDDQTLFVEVDGKPRSVRGLVHAFCEKYLLNQNT